MRKVLTRKVLNIIVLKVLILKIGLRVVFTAHRRCRAQRTKLWIEWLCYVGLI